MGGLCCDWNKVGWVVVCVCGRVWGNRFRWGEYIGDWWYVFCVCWVCYNRCSE